MKASNILITGAGGYIGSVLTEIALKEGYNVTAVDRFFFGMENINRLKSEFDLCLCKKDIRDLRPEDFHHIDIVFDLAALSNDPSGDLNPTLTNDINHLARVNVATMAKKAGVKRYILASSCSVYGFSSGSVLNEDSPTNPLTTYAKANLAAEEGVIQQADNNFTVTVVRQATVFGYSARMRFDLVINIMTLSAVQKGKIYITGGGKQSRPLIHVTDCARAFLLIGESPVEKVQKETFNIGIANYKVINIAYIVRERIPFPVDIEVIPDDADKRDYQVSFNKIEKQLNFVPRLSVEDGITEIYNLLRNGELEDTPQSYTVSWYQKILQAKKLIDEIELNGRLL
jgi:nucleoside-diphosphate-sugar epimerase